MQTMQITLFNDWGGWTVNYQIICSCVVPICAIKKSLHIIYPYDDHDGINDHLFPMQECIERINSLIQVNG
jgi:hypothetical protein